MSDISIFLLYVKKCQLPVDILIKNNLINNLEFIYWMLFTCIDIWKTPSSLSFVHVDCESPLTLPAKATVSSSTEQIFYSVSNCNLIFHNVKKDSAILNKTKSRSAMFSNIQQYMKILSFIQQCSKILSNFKQCLAMLSNAATSTIIHRKVQRSLRE